MILATHITHENTNNYNYNMVVAAAVAVADELAIPHAAAADITDFAAGFAAVAADDGFLGAVMLASNPYPFAFG